MKINRLLKLTLVVSTVALAGCANNDSKSQVDTSSDQLRTIQAENNSLSDKVSMLTSSLSKKDNELSTTKTKLSASETALAAATKLPMGSSAGDCFGLAGDGKSLMKSICPVALSPSVVKSIQAALASAGFNPGPIDGIVGPKTMAAVNMYQQARSLMKGPLSLETVKSLGVM